MALRPDPAAGPRMFRNALVQAYIHMHVVIHGKLLLFWIVLGSALNIALAFFVLCGNPSPTLCCPLFGKGTKRNFVPSNKIPLRRFDPTHAARL